MNNSKSPRRFLLCFVAAILVVNAPVAFDAAGQQGQSGPTGDLSVVGEVSVNGTNAISGATVFSDSTITTRKGSSAVVSLGKLGRVEVLPESTMKLSFTGSRITIRMLDAGRVRVSSSSGTGLTVATRDGETVGDSSRKNEMVIDTRCGNTTVFVKTGQVDIRDFKLKKTIRPQAQHTVGTGKAGCTASAGD
ncbi:MAG TPA: hypothetical protein VFX97_04880 [Pyrinomonadaceae bacterium]|nr:hypothetical protein [Pyrinomonadaceae bacterium]